MADAKEKAKTVTLTGPELRALIDAADYALDKGDGINWDVLDKGASKLRTRLGEINFARSQRKEALL